MKTKVILKYISYFCNDLFIIEQQNITNIFLSFG